MAKATTARTTGWATHINEKQSRLNMNLDCPFAPTGLVHRCLREGGGTTGHRGHGGLVSLLNIEDQLAQICSCTHFCAYVCMYGWMYVCTYTYIIYIHTYIYIYSLVYIYNMYLYSANNTLQAPVLSSGYQYIYL